MPFVTGVYLAVGRSWFAVFEKCPPQYMAPVTLTGYGIFCGGARAAIRRSNE
jgi:hypothetical protein